MKLIIDIPEKEYDIIKNSKGPMYWVEHLIAKGTPLPKGWIPVSERLPNLNDYIGSKTWQKEVLITGYLSFDGPKDLFVSEVFAEDVIYNRVPDTIVVAWMPKPEPYKAESEGKETVYEI